MDTQTQINNLFTTLLNIGTGVGVAICAFCVMMGAYMCMSAGGNPMQMRNGKQAIAQALGGLALVLAARALAGLIQSAFGG